MTDPILNSEIITRDFINLFCDKLIGSGSARYVYDCSMDKTVVIKVETGAESFQNQMEWKLWNEVKDTPFEKYFAPCVHISPCGTVLIQKKVEMIPKKDYPDRVPHFFYDRKYQNYGLYEKRFVCFDYGTHVITNGFTKKLKKADWWDE